MQMTATDRQALSILAADGVKGSHKPMTVEEAHRLAMDCVTCYIFNIIAHEAAHAECCGAQYA